MVISYGGKTPKIGDGCFLAGDADLIGDVEIGRDSSVWFHANVQDGCIVHMDPGRTVRIGSRVTIGHGAIIHGCTVEDDCLIGMGATLMNGCHIGRNCIIGAGALVTQDVRIPEGSMVLGVPARVVRQITEAERESIRANAARYRQEAQEYR